MKSIGMALGTLLLAACGSQEPLRPVAGQSLPPRPYGATYTPDSEDLLEPSVLAVPERSIELRERSEERADDPFDLPPE